MTKASDVNPTADGAGRHPNVRPKHAATLIVLRRKARGIEFLMGRRSRKHVFMPGMVVFPGGRIDRADYTATFSNPLDESVLGQMGGGRGGPLGEKKAHALALCAIRETFEETGILIGQTHTARQTSRNPSWQAFYDHNVLPDLTGLRLIARAITPPRHSRRFDTWFFATFADQIAAESAVPDDELEAPEWLTPDAARSQDLPIITRQIIGDLEDRLNIDPDLSARTPVPFYFKRHGRFHRETI